MLGVNSEMPPMHRYQQNIQLYNEKIARLTEDLAADDPLTLRKKEREEIMKGVLRWLLGPNFHLALEELDKLYDETTGGVNPDVWRTVLERGEFNKFLHNAIEWENMLYFLYPYFWASSKKWELRKYLQHPDILHKAFLKSGSARVVVTIRPGFEKLFARISILPSN